MRNLQYQTARPVQTTRVELGAKIVVDKQKVEAYTIFGWHTSAEDHADYDCTALRFS